MTAGAAVERTRLAWRRTTLVVSVTSVLMVAAVAHRGISPARAAALTLAMLVWLGFLAVGQRRIRSLHASTAGNPPGIARAITLTGLAVGVLAAISLTLI